MLKLTKEKLFIGSKVGYREGYDTGIDGFRKDNIGTVIRKEGDFWEVAFPDGTDLYAEHQLVLLED